MEETLLNVKQAIERSGFPLEHYIGLVLKKHGWQIITNRNYIDDIKGVEREIDVLAYKLYSDKTENIEYITTLIISCKKSDKHKWCFLTRDIDVDDCNINWTPFHYCTSDDRLKYMSEKHLDIIIDRYKSHRAVKHLYSFDNLVFAYQQLSEPANGKDGKNGKLCVGKNDDIYNSISTTIKAISNEKDSRLRAYDYTEKQRYYTFHALSIFEGEMFDAHFDTNGTIDTQEIYNIKYLNRHIVGGIDDFYIVHFINRDIFDYRLCLFDYLHDENIKTLPKFITEYYKNILLEPDKLMIFWDAFSEEIISIITFYSIEIFDDYDGSGIAGLTFGIKKNCLYINILDHFENPEETMERLNAHVVVREETKEALEQYYRYKGDFKFTIGNRF